MHLSRTSPGRRPRPLAGLAAGAVALTLGAGVAEAGPVIFGVDFGAEQQVVSFDADDPGNLLSAVQIGRSGGPGSGLAPNENLVGVDYRPSTGDFYGVGSSGRLYTIGTDGFVTLVAQLNDPTTGLPVALNGTQFGVDFNPVTDLLRITSNLDQNLAVNPDTSAVVVQGDINDGADGNPNLVASAYINNVAGATSTTLYGIDSVTDSLVTQVPATGALTTVGSLGVDVTSLVGFDILTEGDTNTGYAAMQLDDDPATSENESDASRLFRIDLASGAATDLGIISNDEEGFFIRGIAVAPGDDGGGGEPNPIPLPGAAAMFPLAAALAGLSAWRTRRRMQRM